MSSKRQQAESSRVGQARPESSLYDVDANDPRSALIDRSGVSGAEINEINTLMRAMGQLRESEDRLSQASLDCMKLGKTDMKALHYLIVSENSGEVATATRLAAHLEITSASTTKLLDRLERGGHITRSEHPTDRRSQMIRITPETRTAAMETVGAQQARRFHVAARLSTEEREIVTKFLSDTAAELETGMDWAAGED